jgi:hypothetical protein
VVTAALVTPAPADDATKKVIDKAITAHGGLENLKKYKAAKAAMKGDMSVAGTEITFEGTVASEFPGKYKVAVDASVMGQKLSILQVANGDKMKNRVSFGGMDVSAGSDEEKEELKAASALQDMGQIYPLLDDKKFSLKAESDAEVDGKKVAVVAVTVLDTKKTVTLSFDKATGLLVKTQRKGRGPGPDGSPKDVDEESFFSDFKKINGVMQAMKKTVKFDGAKFMSYTLSGVEVLETLPKSTFAVDD